MAILAATPLVLTFDPATLSMDERYEYLRRLFNADVDPFVFVGTARRLGYALDGRWDYDTGAGTHPCPRDPSLTHHVSRRQRP